MTVAQTTIQLDKLADGEEATVVAVQSPQQFNGTSASHMPDELLRRLIDIGFLPGERVRILARGIPGGSPLAVRVGTSTFALRKIEARCVQVRPLTVAAM